MNDKLRSILHTAWEDPRHFFFWLTMIGLLGFIAIAVSMMAGQTSLLTMAETHVLVTVLAFAALGCLLGVAVGIPCFILVWIPPVRRLLVWLLGRRWLALGCLITLVALFYAIEDWRGRRAWQSFKREREAKAERFDWASLAPPPVPKEQNFFETPLWEDLHWEATNSAGTRSDEEGEHPARFTAYGPDARNAPSTGSWLKAQRVDLAAWQGYYRGSSNEISTANTGLNPAAQQAFVKRYGMSPPLMSPPTNYFPVAKEPQSPAADVLLALSRFETNRQLLLASAARPQARFWINYDAGFGILFPHLARIKACAQFLSLHANAGLKAGDRQTALEDLKLQFRLMEALRREPVLISQLVCVGVLHVGLQPLWEGLADRQWTDADLGVIETELGKLDYLADYQLAMRGERACSLWGVDYARNRGLNALGEMGSGDDPSTTAEAEKAVGTLLGQLVPAGWYNQNKLSLCRNNEFYLLPAVDQESRIISPPVVQKLQTALGKLQMSPYDMFSRMLMPALAGCAEKFARAQTTVDLARLACALERYRLANGQFPETLQPLAPKFIETLPHDVINGQPLKFRRTDDGQFVLYSVGWNGTDDGGKVELTKSGTPDAMKGDWVWRYPAR